MSRYVKTMSESYQEVHEKLKPSDGAGAYIKDFRKSDAPQFKGKSDKQIQKMAVAAYLDDKEENMNIGMNEKMMKGFVVRYTDKSGERLAIPYKTKDRAKEEVKALKKVGAKDIEITTHNLNFKEEGDHEISMARGELEAISDKALELSSALEGMSDEGNPLEAWVQSKITKAKDYINSVSDYLLYNPDIKMEETQLNEFEFRIMYKKGNDEYLLDKIFKGSQGAMKIKRKLGDNFDVVTHRSVKDSNMKIKKLKPGPKIVEETELEEKAPDTADAMKRYKSGNAGFTDKAHLKAKGLIPRADGTKKVSDKYKEDVEEGFASDAQRRAAFAQGYKAKGKKDKKEEKTKFERYTGVPNPRTEGRKSNYATDDEDEEGANKNIIMQLYKAISLRGRFDVVFDDGKKQKVKEPIAQKAIAMHRTFKTSKDRLAFQKKISKSYRDLLNAIR